MLRLSKKVKYALIAMMEVANHTSVDLVTAKSLAKQFNIPGELLGKVLQALTRKGILISVQGVKGGYTLGMPLQDISMLSVIEAVDGPISLISCTEGKICDCSQITNCNIRTPMEIIQNELSEFFYNISLIDIKEKYGDIISLVSNTTKQAVS